MDAHLAAADKNLQDAATFGDDSAKRAILEALRVIRYLRYHGVTVDDFDVYLRQVPESDSLAVRMVDHLLSHPDILGAMLLASMPPPRVPPS